MNAFDGRPDLLIIFISQIAFIVVQILIYLRVSRSENFFGAGKNTSSKKQSRAKKR